MTDSAIDTLQEEEQTYDFHVDIDPVFSTGKGLNESVVRQISAQKNEPEWMLNFRLEALKAFLDMPLPSWGPDLSGVKFDDILYYQKMSEAPVRDWADVPDKVKETFERLGVPKAEQAYLAGTVAQYESITI